MYADEVRAPEWRPESESNERNKRVLSIEELRKRLGVAAPEEQATRRKTPPKEEATRPRIVLRGAMAH